jgi:hypothetical protein
MRVTEDIVIGSLLSESKDDNRRTRVIRFEDVTGPDYLATVANSAECPKKGNGFPPGRGYTGSVVDRNFKHPGNKKSVVIATIMYSSKVAANDGQGGSGGQANQPEIIGLSINGVLVPIQTELDYKQRPMQILWSPSFVPGQKAVPGQTSQGASPYSNEVSADKDDRRKRPYRVSDYDVYMRVEITIREALNPIHLESYINTTNSKPLWGFERGVWWIENIGGPTQFPPGVEVPASILFENKYVLVLNRKGWMKLGTFTDPKLGGVPANHDLPPQVNLVSRDSEDNKTLSDTDMKAAWPYGNAWSVFRIKGESDHNNLKLPNIMRIGGSKVLR